MPGVKLAYEIHGSSGSTSFVVLRLSVMPGIDIGSDAARPGCGFDPRMVRFIEILRSQRCGARKDMPRRHIRSASTVDDC
eukprot:3157591-Rhodomonas_salina.5